MSGISWVRFGWLPSAIARKTDSRLAVLADNRSSRIRSAFAQVRRQVRVLWRSMVRTVVVAPWWEAMPPASSGSSWSRRAKLTVEGWPVGDLCRCPLADDAAGVHDGQPISQRLRLVQVVGREQHGGPGVAQAPDQPPHIPSALGVEAGGGLIEEDELRLAHQGARQVEATSLSTGEPPDGRPLPVGEVEHRERVGDRPGTGHCRRPHPQGLGDGEVTGEAAELEEDAGTTAYFGTVPDRIEAEHPDLTRRRLPQTLDDLQGRGLAGAVGAEQGGDRATSDVEVEAADRFEGRRTCAVGTSQAADPDGGFGVLVHASSLGPDAANRQCVDVIVVGGSATGRP